MEHPSDDKPAPGGDFLLSARAYQRLRAMIVTGILPGGSLVQERRLAEQLALSRTPVRDALGRLEGERMLQRQGRLLFVATVSIQEVISIFDVRRLIESQAARRAAQHMNDATIESLMALERDHAAPACADPGAMDEDHWRRDDLFHTAIAQATANLEIERIVAELRQRTRMFGATRLPCRVERGRNEHRAILDAIRARNPDEAAALMTQHIDAAQGAIVASITAGDIETPSPIPPTPTHGRQSP
ncbi:GntR family transcriptional regulator [Gluconacetobacter tumulisoli]|uniref:GntR family transcriptional regulator n=1 Tax=Gluconacetobacter tumulisoli TaxID=1286189 RepID=A0A7W4K9W8_9PROT|nr:GntR family transcriptional regulator [Gluconacetobacter tumulisoli]MBB2203044.1 GntR family transcriptional regulator [Gluconacetobacter tumulisoli]